MIVLDASLINKLFLPYESGRDQVKVMVQNHLLGLEEIIVPELLIYEVANTLATKTDILLPQSLESLSQLCNLNLKIVAFSEEAMKRTIEFAKKYKVTVYDASYAVLAKQKRCDLITADEKFVKAVKLPFVKTLSE